MSSKSEKKEKSKEDEDEDEKEKQNDSAFSNSKENVIKEDEFDIPAFIRRKMKQ